MSIIYISVNNWTPGINYPKTGFFEDNYKQDCDGWDIFTEEYCREHKLCVSESVVDMSQNVTIAAPEEWVRKTCPEILDNQDNKDMFVYKTPGGDRYGKTILEYKEENIGYHFEL